MSILIACITSLTRVGFRCLYEGLDWGAEISLHVHVVLTAGCFAGQDCPLMPVDASTCSDSVTTLTFKGQVVSSQLRRWVWTLTIHLPSGKSQVIRFIVTPLTSCFFPWMPCDVLPHTLLKLCQVLQPLVLQLTRQCVCEWEETCMFRSGILSYTTRSPLNMHWLESSSAPMHQRGKLPDSTKVFSCSPIWKPAAYSGRTEAWLEERHQEHHWMMLKRYLALLNCKPLCGMTKHWQHWCTERMGLSMMLSMYFLI
jgi:hypothetical protein